jgi:hypothetical protein
MRASAHFGTARFARRRYYPSRSSLRELKGNKKYDV